MIGGSLSHYRILEKIGAGGMGEESVDALREVRSRGELPAFLEQPLDELLVELDWERRDSQ